LSALQRLEIATFDIDFDEVRLEPRTEIVVERNQMYLECVDPAPARYPRMV
jgi:hypothetical protein